MQSNVKFVNIAVTMGNDLISPTLYGLDTDGQLWRKTFGCDWVKSQMPVDWQKSFDDELKHTAGLATIILRGAHPQYMKSIHDSCVRLAHAAFMLLPELREE